MTMKIKFLLALFMSCALGASAQGYLDGIDYYQADQYSNAKTILERTINDADTDKAVAYYYLGQLAIKYQELDKAVEYFNKGIEANPNYAYNYVGLAAVDLKKGNKKEAENNIKQAKKLGKKDAKLLVDVARAFYDADKNKYQKDINKVMKESYKISIEEPNYYLFVGDTIIVNASNNKELGNAAAYYDQAIQYAPNSAYTVVKYSSLYEKLNPALAIQSMRNFLASNPNSALAQRELAERLYTQEQYKEAAIEYGKYIKMPGHFVEDEERYAILLFSSNNPAEAFEVAKVAAEKSKNPFVMERIMFYSKVSLNEYAEAHKYAKNFFDKYPEPQHHSVGDFLNYATITQNLAQTDTANTAAHIDQSIKIYNDLLVVDTANTTAYKQLASLYSNKKDYNNAVLSAEKVIVLSESPKDSDYRTLATILADQADAEVDPAKKQEIQARALSTIEKAVEITNSPYVARAAGQIYYQIQGSYTSDYERHFRKSLELLDSDSFYAEKAKDMYKTVLRSLGVYYYTIAKDNAQAKEIFTRYLEFAPEDSQIAGIVAKM